MAVIDARTGQLYDAGDKAWAADEIIQVAADALYTVPGSLKYRPEVGSILATWRRDWAFPQRHLPEINRSVVRALAGYISYRDISLRLTAQGLYIHLLDSTLVVT